MSPRVEFYTAVTDPISFACRLLRKASRQGSRLVVMGPAPTLQRLDRSLWTFEERDFVPHIVFGEGTSRSGVQQRSPIWLVPGLLPPQHPDILLNLGADVVPLVGQFSRVIELVSSDADMAANARARWRRYRAMGLAIVHHPLGAQAAAGGSEPAPED